MELGLGVTVCEIQPPARRWNDQWSTGSDPPTKPTRVELGGQTKAGISVEQTRGSLKTLGVRPYLPTCWFMDG